MWIALLITAMVTLYGRKRNKNKIKNTTAKLLILIFAVTFLKTGYAQTETFAVQGKLHLNHARGVVYIYLVDKKTFPVPFTRIAKLKSDADNLTLKYNFQRIKKGKYAIRYFQDLNNNQKLDKELFNPTKPYRFSWKNKRCFPFDFEDISFIVNHNLIININI